MKNDKKSKNVSPKNQQGKNGQHRALTEEEIRQRAYEIYLARGGEPGHELDDWLQAQGELHR
jgi:hypothetical protein